MRANAYPQSIQSNLITRRVDRFDRGWVDDYPATSIGDAALYDVENWIVYQKYCMMRSGTTVIGTSALPSLYTGIAATKSGTTITISGGYTVTVDDTEVGWYFVHDDDTHDYITSSTAIGNTLTVSSTTTRAASTAGWIRAEINARDWHETQQKIVMLLGQKLYYSTWNTATWSEIYCLSQDDLPTDAKSRLLAKGDDLYLLNSNGWYRVELSATVPVFYKINNAMTEQTIGDIGETTENKYSRRYLCSLTAMTGNTLLDRTSSAQTVAQQSCSNKRNSANRDYAEIFTERPMGPSDYTYGILTGGTLDAGADTPAEWAAIADGEANFTANGETYYVRVNFSGCESWADVTNRVQIQLRDYWPDAIVELYQDGGNKTFRFTMPNKGDSIGYCTDAAGAGTDISGATGTTYLKMATAQATISVPDFYNTEGTFKIGAFKSTLKTAPFPVRSLYGLVTFNDTLFLFGGLSSGLTLKNDVWSSEDGITWTQVTAAANWSARSSFGFCVYDDKIWLSGGEDATSEVWSSSDGKTWTRATDSAAFGSARSQHKMLVYDGKMWVICGVGKKDVYSSTDGVTWTQVVADAGIDDRYGFGACVYNDKMWVAGGFITGSTGENDVYYSTDGITWTKSTASAFAQGRGCFDILSFDNKMWAMAGYYTIGGVHYYLADIWYSSDGVTWTQWAENARFGARASYGSCVLDEKIWVLAGWDNTGTRIADVWYASNSYLQLPHEASGANYLYQTWATHYTQWAAKDTGPNGINISTGKGNNPNLYIWHSDIPIIKSFVITTDASGNVTAAKGTFNKYDIGSTLRLSDDSYGEILTYVSSTKVTWNKVDIKTSLAAAIGTTLSFKATQSGTTVTISGPAGGRFASTCAGLRIFWDDGTMSVITGYTSATVATVADSTTRAAMGGGIIDTPDTTATANTRKFYDDITDDQLSDQISVAVLQNRWFEPLPDCDTGVLMNGWIVGGLRGQKRIYYSQVPFRTQSLVGYYYPQYQTDDLEGRLVELLDTEFTATAVCNHITINYDTTAVAVETIAAIGQSVSFFARSEIKDRETGCLDWTGITGVGNGIYAVKTNSNEIRVWNGTEYGPNYASNRIMKRMQKLQAKTAMSYDEDGGLYVWGTEGALSNSHVPFPDICYRFAITPEQGIGPSRVTGTSWIRPPDGINGFKITDTNNNDRQVVFDNISGTLYWISTRTGPTGSSMTRTFVDKDTGAGVGTEISGSLVLAAHTGTTEHYFLRHLESHFYFRPYDETNRDATGYDDGGYRDDLAVNIEAYRNNEPTTYFTRTLDIAKDGDITFLDNPESNVIQLKISVNRSEVLFVGSVHYYDGSTKQAAPDNRVSTESDYQREVSLPVLWVHARGSSVIDRATGNVITGASGCTVTTGVSSRNTAASFATAQTFGSVALTAGSLFLWYQGTIASLKIGATSVSLTTVGTYGSWTLAHATAITATGSVIITPSTTVIVDDFRIVNSAISAEFRTYYYNDVNSNSGDEVLIKG